ncbi:hypothetical protein D3H54_29645 [Mycobacterium sp. ELW1]|nr:hypothetical protein D3H54_29645 [Mycobacterium sp. ELW1]
MVDQALGRRGNEERRHAVGTPAGVDRGRCSVDGPLVISQLRLGGFEHSHIVGVLLLRGALQLQLLLEVQLDGLRGFDQLLRLFGQLVQLGQLV